MEFTGNSRAKADLNMRATDAGARPGYLARPSAFITSRMALYSALRSFLNASPRQVSAHHAPIIDFRGLPVAAYKT